ncbi:MAG: hypothetical protein ACN6OI_20275 [Flavobacterium sp.]|uniref:hypothetical protein n=1 Tax=Flavobacterium sp. TaxID=239 RepID=UPI003D0E6D61
MDLQIDKVIDYGTQSSERILLNVIADCNLKYYILADTTYTDATHISNKLRHMYWFTPKDVKKGDKIVIYTKNGSDTKTSINNGLNTTYTFYWDLKNSVWNNTGDSAILFNLNTWKTTKVI